MRISLESANQPEALGLIAELDAYQAALYPAESNHGIDLEALSRPNVLFAVARNIEGPAVGCGAVVLHPTFGELKRMFVRPQHRGHGIAKAVLAFLEVEAHVKGCTVLRLETGISQPEALGLYARSGYARRGPFEGYAPDPLSVFMERQIGG
jgi:putative acetyltransferase